MRLFLTLVLFSILFSGSVFGQTKAARANYEAATAFARNGDFERAISLYRAALAKLPEDADSTLRARITFNIGVAFYRTGRIEDAIPFYKKALQISGGKYSRAIYALGMAQSELKDLNGAVESFEQYLQLIPRDGEAWFDLGLVRYELGDMAAARKAFENAYKNGTVALADALNNIGVVMAKEGDIRGAVGVFEAALRKSDNQNAAALGNLLICRSGEGLVSLTLSNTHKIQEKTNE